MDNMANIQILRSNYIKSTTTITTTSCPTGMNQYLYDRSRLTKCISVNNTDATPEVFTIDFGTVKSVGAILLDNHNFKNATIKYWNGSSAADFATPLALVNNALETNYFQPVAVSTSKIQITVTGTTTPNQRKYIGSLYITDKIFTPVDNPSTFDYEFIESNITLTMADGGKAYINLNQKFHVIMKYDDCSNADLFNFNSLKSLGEPFLIYPCGGATDVTNIGFRPYDIYLCNYVNNLKPTLRGGLFNNGSTVDVELFEV